MPPQLPDALAVPVTVGASPGSPNGTVPERPGETVTLKANLRAEYVAASGQTAYAQYLKALPWHLDELTAQFGDDLYDRMLLDAQISADVTRFKAAILEDGATLTNAIADETDDGYEQGAEIADTLTAMLADIETPLDDVLWNLLDACALGNKVAEQVYTYQTVAGRRMLALQRLAVKPRRSTAFVVDAYNRTVGLLGIMASAYSPVQIGTILSDPSRQPNLLPPEKFAILTWRPVDGDPRGNSLIRAAYKPWWLKQQIVGDFLKFIAQFAGPSVLGFTPPDAQAVPLTDALGNLVLDANGNPQMTTPEQVMLTALEAWRNGTAAAFRGGSAVTLVQSTGEGLAFLRAFQWCDQQIGKSITSQVLATEEGSHQARAAAEVHQDTMDTLVRQGKRSIQRLIRNDILQRLVAYNWGEQVAKKLTPIVSLGSTEEHDWVKELQAVARAYSVGWISESQKPKLDERLGMPERDPAVDAAHARVLTMTRPEVVRPVEGAPPETQQQAQPKLGTAPGGQQPAEQKAGAA